VSDDLVGRALERQPARRFQSAGELAAALDAWRLGRGEHVDAAICARWLDRLLLALPPTTIDADADPLAVALPVTAPFPAGAALETVPEPLLSPAVTVTATMTSTTASTSSTSSSKLSFRRLVLGAVAAVAVVGVGLGVGAGAPAAASAPSSSMASTETASSPSLPARASVVPASSAIVDAPVAVAVRPLTAKPKSRRAPPASVSAPSSSGMGRLSVRTTPPTVVSAADDVIDSTPFVGRPVEAGLKRLTLTNTELGIRDEIIVKVPKNRNLALIATWTQVDGAWVLSTKTTREYR